MGYFPQHMNGNTMVCLWNGNTNMKGGEITDLNGSFAFGTHPYQKYCRDELACGWSKLNPKQSTAKTRLIGTVFVPNDF